MPSLYEGFSLPGDRGHGVRRAARGHHRRRAARGGRHRRRDRPAGAARRPRRAGRRARCGCSTTPTCAPGSAPPAAPGSLDQFTWRATAVGHGRATTAPCSTPGHGRGRQPAAGAALMLTVDFDRLDLRAGDRLLDLGCGGGRHAFAAMRRGATRRRARLRRRRAQGRARARVGAMVEAGEIAGRRGRRRRSTATRCACRSPTAPSTASSRSEVLEHICGRRAARSPSWCACCGPAAASPSPCPRASPSASAGRSTNDYHDTPGRPHPHLPAARARGEARAAPGLWLRGSHHAHALHSPYWWLKCAVGVDNTDALAGAHATTTSSCGRSSANPGGSPALDRTLNPVLGKSLVVYTQKVG